MAHNLLQLPNYQYVRLELVAKLPIYNQISDCIEGQVAIKKGGTKYLPQPNAADKSKENDARYAAYLLRAVFYNVAQRTLSGLCGQIYTRDPVINVPEDLQPLVKDVDGTGLTLVQLSKKATRATVSKGRAGILTDFPKTEGTTSRQDIQTGKVKPTIVTYKPENIINWRTRVINGQKKLSLIVIQETYDTEDDGFQPTPKKQFRILRLDKDNLYEMWVFKEGATLDNISKTDHFKPKDGSGNRLDFIPFTFIGAENNDPDIDEPPLSDICSLNIAHYRNSADYEESSYQVGQPTPWVSGLTESWVTDVLKGVIHLGSRAAILLPEGAVAGLLQAEPNTMPKAGMEHKEDQMISIGAKLMSPSNKEKTATEASNDNTAETSTLASSAKNVSAAVTLALEWAALFVGASTDDIQFELNTDFASSNMTAQQRAQLVAEWVAGAISFEEIRDNLRKSGITTQTDEEALKLIKKEIEVRAATAKALSPNSNNQPSQDPEDPDPNNKD